MEKNYKLLKIENEREVFYQVTNRNVDAEVGMVMRRTEIESPTVEVLIENESEEFCREQLEVLKFQFREKDRELLNEIKHTFNETVLIGKEEFKEIVELINYKDLIKYMKFYLVFKKIESKVDDNHILKLNYTDIRRTEVKGVQTHISIKNLEKELIEKGYMKIIPHRSRGNGYKLLKTPSKKENDDNILVDVTDPNVVIKLFKTIYTKEEFYELTENHNHRQSYRNVEPFTFI